MQRTVELLLRKNALRVYKLDAKQQRKEASAVFVALCSALSNAKVD